MSDRCVAPTTVALLYRQRCRLECTESQANWKSPSNLTGSLEHSNSLSSRQGCQSVSERWMAFRPHSRPWVLRCSAMCCWPFPCGSPVEWVHTVVADGSDTQ